jgi:hypothetical protein
MWILGGEGTFLVRAYGSWTCSVETGIGTCYPMAWTDLGSIL